MVPHVDVGTGQVELGRSLIGAAQVVELQIITKVVAQGVFSGEVRFDRRLLQAL
ncbi:hypothetical protein D3C75_1358200 [compost metagenome]